ncbi:hypothetical protein [Bulleidia sp. zg-1006]|uniref:hypothetical protein n=1 Tax=Bulleidia sp. zg-1006 TaxID=2806552 RepID=UPI0019399521|nr:hypothetical protein [Bulleidia sp. zg-1006]QRG86841.1 hypothetical protein JOS54_00555 [Bulleidia sp. zg-1006]
MHYSFFLKWIMSFLYLCLWIAHPQENLSGLVNQSLFYQLIAFGMALQVSYTLYRIQYHKISFCLLISLLLTLFITYPIHPQLHLLFANISLALYTYPFLKEFYCYPSTWKILSLFFLLAALSIISQGKITGLSEYSYWIAMNYFYSYILSTKKGL